MKYRLIISSTDKGAKMNKIFLFVFTIFSISAHADVSAAVFVNSNNTEAKLLINEGMIDGDLSKLFDRMKIAVTGTNIKKTKTFMLKNGRFGFTCNKRYFASTPPATSCTFFIKQGENNNDINTFISKTGDQALASIGMTQIISNELKDIFPADAGGNIGYVLKLPNQVTLEVRGATWGNLVVSFSAQ